MILLNSRRGILARARLVMFQLPSIYDPERIFFPAPEIYTNMCFPIVIGTVIFGAMLGPIIAKRQLTGK